MKIRLLLLAVLSILATRVAYAQVTLTHVHGLAYSADGKRLVIPSHHGLAVYENGKWSKAPGPEHDYMGFSGTATRIYSSGHPAQGSGLVNPFGLLRSLDDGRTWDKLGLEGESDFHVMAAGWNSNAVYVWNPAPNSRMSSAGLHYTLDDGLAWKRAAATGMAGDLRAIAVHPDDAGTLAAATSAGLFLSRDHGARFDRLAAAPAEGLSVFFDLAGRMLWYGAFDGKPRLLRVPLDRGAPTQVGLPALEKDAVAFIAQNPLLRQEYAIATFQRSVFVSSDSGRNWKEIAHRGQGNVALGEQVYAQHCAACHGAKLEGQPEWRKPLPNGRMPAPPHDESGHTWHHPDEVLFAITKRGLVPPYAPAGYQSDMPAFGGTLSDDEIWSVLAYIKSHWKTRELLDARAEMLKGARRR